MICHLVIKKIETPRSSNISVIAKLSFIKQSGSAQLDSRHTTNMNSNIENTLKSQHSLLDSYNNVMPTSISKTKSSNAHDSKSLRTFPKRIPSKSEIHKFKDENINMINDKSNLDLLSITVIDSDEENQTKMKSSNSSLKSYVDNICTDDDKYCYDITNKPSSVKTSSIHYGHTVLVVDDSMMNRKLLARLVSKRCNIIHEADDGNRAVSLVKNAISQGKSYDVILMDYQMPNMDGPTAAREIRNLGFNGYIIGVTGNVLDIDRDHFINSGADKVCFKPIDIGKIDEVVSGM